MLLAINKTISYSKPPTFMDHGRYIVKINVRKLEVDKPGNFSVYLLNIKVF